MFPVLPFLLLSASTALVPASSSMFGAIGVQGGLKRGSKGQQVKNWQYWLMSQGFNFPQYGPDGDFGGETEAATRAFQARNSLTQTGWLDTNTLRKAMQTGYGREKPAIQIMAERAQGGQPGPAPASTPTAPTPSPTAQPWQPPPKSFFERPVVLAGLGLGGVALLGWGLMSNQNSSQGNTAYDFFG